MSIWQIIGSRRTLFVSTIEAPPAEWQIIGSRRTLFVSVAPSELPAEWYSIGSKRTLFVSMAEEEPEEPEGARFRGRITWYDPHVLLPGDALELHISFEAFVDTIWEQVHGWDTQLTAVLDGLSDSDTQAHIGEEGHREDEVLSLGVMPEHKLSGFIILEGRGKNLLGFPTEWQEIDRKSITFTTPEEEKKFPWLPVALMGGGLLLIAASAKPEKGKSLTKIK